MTQAAEPERPPDIAALLVKAAKQLPEDEERVLLAYFLERGLGPQTLTSPTRHVYPRVRADLAAPVARAGALPERSQIAALLGVHRVMGAEQVTIPVRLSQAQHQRLKQWCAKHEFPMAVVVRGLIERFLDEWDKPPPD